MFTPLELSLLAGDLAITSLSAGMDIWIEWYPPEIYIGVRFKKEEIGPRILGAPLSLSHSHFSFLICGFSKHDVCRSENEEMKNNVS